MKHLLAFILILCCYPLQAHKCVVTSPNGKLRVVATDSILEVSYNKSVVQRIVIDAGMLEYKSHKQYASDSYTMIAGKKNLCANDWYECVLSYTDNIVELRVYNDGIAFRFRKGESDIAYIVPNGNNRWIPRMTTDYENQYKLATSAVSGNFSYPALIEYGNNVFGLISEGGLSAGHPASHLKCSSSTCRYQVVTGEIESKYEVSPWRIVMIGTLSDIVESTLVTDVAEPCALEDTSWIEPGVSSWIYWANNHGSKDFQKVKEYINLAAEMGWKYNLIDWEWNEMRNGGDIYDAIAYANKKGVKITLWYNSGTSWIGPGAPGPVDRLINRENREKEFSQLENLGVSGIKVDFFKDDSPATINYYIDILDDAARHHLLVDFHGCTLPRGWQRTYPNLMSMEAVYGSEWYNNNSVMTGIAASHNATLPFTRNVVGSMDYTPGTFSDSQHPHITTWGHELALTVLFESGIQHMPDTYSTYANMPEDVRSFLSSLPSRWDDIRLLDGYPGRFVVLARRFSDVWYIAAINGTDEVMKIPIHIESLGINESAPVILFKDGDDGQSIVPFKGTIDWNSIECLPRGGLVIVTASK